MDIGLPNNFLTLVASSSTSVFEQVQPVATLLLGVLLAFLVLDLVINALTGNKNESIINS